MANTNGSIVTTTSRIVYSSTCVRVYSIPCVTGSIGMPTFAYSSRRSIASAQKCGGVQMKMIRNRISACGCTVPVTAAQPSTGGAAPAAPPMTMFCGVARFRNSV